MKVSLKQALIDSYQSEQLSEQQLATLNGLGEQKQEEKKEPVKQAITDGKKRWYKEAFVASFAAIFLVAIFFYYAAVRQEHIILTIVDEVIANHIKNKPLDVVSQDYSQLRAQMSKLEFSLLDVKHEQLALSEMLGARYCSVKSIPAALLRYNFAQGESMTLYQVPYVKQFGTMPIKEKGEASIERYKNGLRISMWLEKGMLLVLVKPE